jgi:hypothetical protein
VTGVWQLLMSELGSAVNSGFTTVL